MPKTITQEKLKRMFDYRNDGVLIWKISPNKRIKVGSVAGCFKFGEYCRIGIKNAFYKRSRLIFCYHKGYFPEGDVDHKNRMRHDDKIENLRDVSRSCNIRNTGNRKDNTSSVKGVTFKVSIGEWRSRISINRKRCFLGHYKTFDNAVCARLAAEQCLEWSGCDSSSPAYKYVKRYILK